MSKWEDEYNKLNLDIDKFISKQDRTIKRIEKRKNEPEKSASSAKINELRKRMADLADKVDSPEYKKLKKELGELKKAQKEKINEKATKDEEKLEEAKKEKERLEKIKPNLNKIANIIDYRDRLKDELKQLKDEMEIRKNLEEAADKKDELEEKIAKYQSRYEDISKKLKSKELTEDERKKLETEKSEISEKMPKAQEERDKAEDTLFKGLGEKRELSQLPKQEMDKKIFETQTKISKCNLVAKNLLQGLNWEQIDMKLDNWKDKKFTSKDDKLADDIEKAKKAREEKVNKFELHKNDDKMVDLLELAKKEEEKIEAELPVVKEEKKKSVFGKMKDLFKNGFKNIKDIFSKKETEQTIEEIEEIKEAKSEEKEEKSFKEYIKEIAEKGMDGMAAEEKAARRETAKVKLEEMRKENRAKEAAKFGQDYADKSDYRQKEEER